MYNLGKLAIIITVASSLLINTVGTDDALPMLGVSDFLYQKENRIGLETRGTIRGQLLHEALAAWPGKNIVCSPLAALIPLAKLAIGASSDTLMELLTAVGLRHQREVKTAFKPMISSLAQLTSVTVNLTSQIFVNTKNHLRSKFATEIKDIFRSTVKIISLKRSFQATGAINDWIQQNTQGPFKNMLKPNQLPNPLQSAVLLNAAYFKGKWLEPFTSTVGDFHYIDGNDKIPMMTRTSTYKYFQSNVLFAKIVEIPYQGKEASFVIVLPIHTKDGLPVLLNSLHRAPYLLDVEMQKMKPRNVSLTFPKFRIETELDLSRVFLKMNIRKMLTLGMSDMVRSKPVVFASALQKMVLEVTDGAKTDSTPPVVEPSSPAMGVVEFRANRPFIYFIKVGREPLFAGVFMHR